MRNSAEVLHGDISQNQREVTLKRFKEGKFNVLVATDVASRGLDIPNVDLVVQLEPPKETETYIHRSGRTARAGKEGMCITFYAGYEYDTIQDIEYRAGIFFQKIGPPKQEDVIKVSAADAMGGLKNVNPKLLPMFEEAADKLIEEVGAKEALCMALAFISQTSTTQIEDRSLISGSDGHATFLLKSDREFRTVSYAYKILQRNFDESLWSQVKGMKILKDHAGVAFDMPNAAADDFERDFKEQSCSKKSLPFTVERASEAPELLSEGYGGGSKYGGGSSSRGGFKKQYNSGYQSQRYDNGYGDDDSYNSKPSYGGGYKSRGGDSDSGWGKGPSRGARQDGGDRSDNFESSAPIFRRNTNTAPSERIPVESNDDSGSFGRGRGGGSGFRARGGRGTGTRGTGTRGRATRGGF
jgi:ATP-dependent RNA helicase DDX21